MPAPKRPLEERFWGHVEKSDSCWLWTGSKTTAGYGTIAISRSRPDEAHRVAYELFVAPIPEGLHIDHLCCTPACVRPDHLEAVTQQENNRRTADRRDRCKAGHPYTEDNVYRYNGKRYCRACRRAFDRVRRARA